MHRPSPLVVTLPNRGIRLYDPAAFGAALIEVIQTARMAPKDAARDISS